MAPRLDDIVDHCDPTAVLLFLHGGQQSSFEPVRNRHASWWRVALLARSLRRWARKENLSIALLQYEVRGWNDVNNPSPVADARLALDALRTRAGGDEHRIILVGHSMGGRTACRLANEPGVIGVVALAPWIEPNEPFEHLLDTRLDVLHGTADRWTSPKLSRAFVQKIADRGGSARWQGLDNAGHFMFSRPSRWRRFVTGAAEATIIEIQRDQEKQP